MTRYFFFAGIFSVLLFASCNSGPGPGGQASITGKVYAKGNWNPSCTVYADSSSGFVPFYAPDEDVYLIYGDDASYGDHVKTAPDGTYKFSYLRKGKYTIYAYSKDCTVQAGKTSVTLQVEITDKKQDVQMSDLRINK
jgi:hypothetical protein